MSLSQQNPKPVLHNGRSLKPLDSAKVAPTPFVDPMRQGPPRKTLAKFCCMCGKPMTFSDDPKKKSYELKHSIHWQCREIAERQCDILSQEVRE